MMKMRRIISQLAGIVLLGTMAVQAGVLAGPKKPEVLMVVTSQGRFPGTTEKTGLWLEEFAVPYRIFREAGFAVVVASPQGGTVPVDPRSTTPDALPDNAGDALAVLKNTEKLDRVNPARYAAVFFPGGHGTMFDFPENAPVQDVVEYFLINDRPAAFVCHGPAALVGGEDRRGQPLVKGRQVAAFTDAEEQAVGLADQVPFLLQSRLQELGATVIPADNFIAHVVVDGNLVTGQNPASSAGTAEALLELLRGEKL